MKIAGIIAEYNPFHRGHQYHIAETRRLTGADYVIVVMSGDYVQRGEPAICDKYIRTRMALEGGADLVIELPTVYATASAEFFATAGVKLFDSLKCIDYLSFGSETADLEELQTYADLFTQEPQAFKDYLKEALAMGHNFPKARNLAAKRYLGQDNLTLLEQPNHILAIEYLKALKRLDSPVIPVAVKRLGAGYHDRLLPPDSLEWVKTRETGKKRSKKIEAEWRKKVDTFYPSATSMRGYMKDYVRYRDEDSLLILHLGLPDSVASIRLLDHMVGRDYMTWEDLKPYLDYNILMRGEEIGQYFGMNSELSRRLKRLHQPGQSLEQLLKCLHSKAMTDTAIRRALLHIALLVEDEPWLSNAAEIPVPYARILGFRKEAGPLIKHLREHASIDILQKPVDGKNLYQKNVKRSKANQKEAGTSASFDRKELEKAAFLFETDIRAASLYEQMAALKSEREPMNEYQRQVIIV